MHVYTHTYIIHIHIPPSRSLCWFINSRIKELKSCALIFGLNSSLSVMTITSSFVNFPGWTFVSTLCITSVISAQLTRRFDAVDAFIRALNTAAFHVDLFLKTHSTSRYFTSNHASSLHFTSLHFTSLHSIFLEKQKKANQKERRLSWKRSATVRCLRLDGWTIFPFTFC